MKSYDYLIVGAGLYGATFAHKLMQEGKTVLVLEREEDVGGFLRSKQISGINVGLFGPHVFFTNDYEVWNFVNSIEEFKEYKYEPIFYKENKFTNSIQDQFVVDKTFEGLPKNTFNSFIKKLLKGATVLTNTNYLDDKEKYNSLAKKIIYTGPIDEFFNYKFGVLKYQNFHYEIERIDKMYFQKSGIVKYLDNQDKYLRIIEHKYFYQDISPVTIISKETLCEFIKEDYKFFPISNDENINLLNIYREKAKKLPNIKFKGRLAEFKFYTMEETILNALKDASEELNYGKTK